MSALAFHNTADIHSKANLFYSITATSLNKNWDKPLQEMTKLWHRDTKLNEFLLLNIYYISGKATCEPYGFAFFIIHYNKRVKDIKRWKRER